MSEIKIDKGVPMPDRSEASNAGRSMVYPWKEMEIGDSFLLKSDVKTASRQCWAAAKRYAPRRFASRKTPEGYRVWRIA